LQSHPNNDLPRRSSERGKGAAGAIIIHLLLFALLILVGFSAPPPPDNGEGILVNFGTDATGFGDIEPSPPAVQEEASARPVEPQAESHAVPKASKKSDAESLLSQETDEAPAVKKAEPVAEKKKVDPEAEKKRIEKAEADKKIKEQLEAERIIKQKEEAEKKQKEAELQRQTDIMNRTKNALANSKNSGTSSTSEGIAGGTGNQGDPRGSVDSKVRGEGGGLGTSGTGTGDKGVSFQLQGRGFQKLPPPKYDYQGEGTVVVEVSVDKSGKVIRAVPGAKGSTTLDEYLLKVARDAAMEARFNSKPDAPEIQKGTITYNFKLK
jgi:colicin import membrane protein